MGVAARMAALALVPLILLFGFAASAQQPASPPQPAAPPQPASQDAATPSATQPSQATQPPAAPAPDAAPAQPAATDQPAPVQPAPEPPAAATRPAQSSASISAHSSEDQGGITEEEIKQQLVGKELYLRGGFLDDSLSFNEHGGLIGHSPQGSYTLCGVEIDRVHLTKHKLELEGSRYGLHFLGAMPYEDPTKAVDRVKITPRKKVLRITVDREVVVKPKKEKEPKGAAAKAKPAAAPTSASAAAAEPSEPTNADEAKAEIAAAPPEERPADPSSVTTTTSPAHAAGMLKNALDKIFAPGLDDRMMAAMPDFWKLYYEAAANKTDYRPKDPSVLRQGTVDVKAHLITNFEPASNQFAQDSGVAGMALYHVVIGADGKPGEIAVARPIGFGLDESAVAAIGNARFEPATKDGKPVPVMLDLVVQFRIYSKRTSVSAGNPAPDEAAQPKEAILPGPYTAQREAERQSQTQPQPDSQAQPHPQSQPQEQPPAQPQPQPQPQQ
jgi:TonB family protein